MIKTLESDVDFYINIYSGLAYNNLFIKQYSLGIHIYKMTKSTAC